MKGKLKKLASRYVKLVEWSEEDRCFVGRCPELFGGGIHGDDEVKVYAELAALVAATVSDLIAEGKTLPVPVAGQNFSGKFVFRPGPELHKALSVRAWREGKSLNQLVLDAVSAHTAARPARKNKRLHAA